MTGVGELMEVILYVEDMNAQVQFYRDMLGLSVRWPQHQDDYHKESWVELDTGACTLALHSGGMRRLGQDAPKIVFRVRDIESVREALLEKGVQLGLVRQAAPGVLVVDGMDQEGNKFSIESHK